MPSQKSVLPSLKNLQNLSTIVKSLSKKKKACCDSPNKPSYAEDSRGMTKRVDRAAPMILSLAAGKNVWSLTLAPAVWTGSVVAIDPVLWAKSS
jgi:hypothetical protein